MNTTTTLMSISSPLGCVRARPMACGVDHGGMSNGVQSAAARIRVVAPHVATLASGFTPTVCASDDSSITTNMWLGGSDLVGDMGFGSTYATTGAPKRIHPGHLAGVT